MSEGEAPKKSRRKKAARSAKAWAHAIQRLPELTGAAIRHGALPAGVRAIRTASKEGGKDLHWKVLGDSVVRFFQHSGPVLTKLGQILATRTDLLPQAVCARLEVLYDKQPPMAEKELRKILKGAYPEGMPFERFELKPLGVGSVGQVHRARLADGSPVIVKVLRPGARREIERDVDTARTVVAAFFSTLGRKKPAMRLMVERVLEDLETAFLSELDLESEARSIREFRDRLRGNPRVYVPLCHSELSSRHVLVIEELEGEPLSRYRERAAADPKAAKRIAEVALKEILTQIFDHGRFHADPHAGNLMVLPDGRLGLIDFGLTGEFTSKDRRQIARAVRALLARDADGLISSLLEFGTRPADFDALAFKQDLVEVLGKKKEGLKAQLTGTRVPGQETDALDTLVNDLFTVSYRHKIYVPQSTTLLIKTLVTIEGVARSLDPEVSVISAAIPVVVKSLTPKWLRFGEIFARRKQEG